MKKIIVVLFALLLLAGCSNKNHYSYLSDGDDLIFKGPNDVTYTKNDLYKSLKVSNEDAITSDILDKIATKIEGVDLEALEAEADELIETYQSLGYESYIVASYGSVDAYRKAYISTLLMNELAKEYVRLNYDSMLEEKKPVKMQVAIFANEEDAQKCIDDVNSGSTFDMAAVNNNAESAPISSVYTDDDTSLVLEVKEYLNSTDNTGLSTIIVNTKTATDTDGNSVETKTYYVLNIESRNPDDFKDDLIQLLASGLDSSTVKSYFLATHEIEFFDQDIYELMTTAYEVLK